MNAKTLTLPNIVAIAKLANLPLKDSDVAELDKQLTVSLDFVSQLKKVSTVDVRPTSQVTGLENVLREDVVENSLVQEDALKNAPRVHNGYFVVDVIFDE